MYFSVFWSTACYLEKYSTAKSALEKGASVAPNESKFKKMLDECNLLIAGITQAFKKKSTMRFSVFSCTNIIFF